MQKMQIFFSQNLYEEHLSTINNIHFTVREIDVIACIFGARKTSKIAYFLSISTRTVETHVCHIMAKLECNTRESIVDFIEKSDKIHFLRRYYSLLQVEAIFKKSLKDIARLNREKNLGCFLTSGKNKDPLLTHLKSHLRLAGIIVSDGARKKEEDCLIVVLPKDLPEEEISFFFEDTPKSLKKILCLLQERTLYKADYKKLRGFTIVDFSMDENYYFSFFSLLKKILLIDSLDKIISEFKDKYSKIHKNYKLLEVVSNDKDQEKHFIYQIKSKFLLPILCGIGLFGSGFLVFHWSQRNENYSFRSDFVIPTESVLLHRPELISQMDEKLKGQNAIQTIALIGPAGAGKTTLARQYARIQKARSIWEVNAETRESLNTSFERLAHVLAKTEDAKKALREIQEIKENLEKEERTVQFVKEQMKFISNWLLIFDNVKTFADIQKYFPHDSETWGVGKIILTTRDLNIENNKYINNIISIGELTPEQKLILFTKIMTKGNTNSFSITQADDIKHFLKKIPSFPLDVSVAAYYLKITNIPYSTYLENLYKFNKEFTRAEENILKEIGEYTKTRYNIIILSLKKLLDENKEFENLLLLISLLDSQNIPIDLLNYFKNAVLVNDFIVALKKYSLLINNSSTVPSQSYAISIHRSTQTISLTYLIQKLELEKDKKLLNSSVKAIEDYTVTILEEENVLKMKPLIRHYEALLSHGDLLNDLIKGSTEGKLGCLLYYLGDYKKSMIFLKKSLLKLNKISNISYVKKAFILTYLGQIYSELDDDKKAKDLLQRSLAIYKKFPPKNPAEIARALLYLGNIYRRNGNYQEAKKVLLESMMIYKSNFSETHNEFAQALAYLGNVYMQLGNYLEARNVLEQSFAIYKQYFPENFIRISWILAILGNIERELGKYEKSRSLLNNSLTCYKKVFPDDHPNIAWALTNLGLTYLTLGEYKKAKNAFEKSFLIYKKYYGENHLKSAWALMYLGEIYQKLGDSKKAKYFLERSFNIYKRDLSPDHPGMSLILTMLGTVYKNLKEYEKSKSAFEKNLNIHNKLFGKDNIRTALLLTHFGTLYTEIGDYENAQKLFEQSFMLYKANFGEEHTQAALVSTYLGEVYLLKGEIEKAEDFLNKALKVLQRHNHVDRFICLEKLSDLFLKKSILKINEGKRQLSQDFRNQAISFLNQALATVRTHFPDDSPHIARIQSKIKAISE